MDAVPAVLGDYNQNPCLFGAGKGIEFLQGFCLYGIDKCIEFLAVGFVEI